MRPSKPDRLERASSRVRGRRAVAAPRSPSIAPNAIMVRGYHLDEMMGRLSFADAVYLLLMGELPTRAIGRMLDAILVSVIDHGVTPPSTLAARNVAASRRAAQGLAWRPASWPSVRITAATSKRACAFSTRG